MVKTRPVAHYGSGIRSSASIVVRPSLPARGWPDARSIQIIIIMETLFTAEAISKTGPYSQALRGDTSVKLVVD
jgi:hypothetical protein